MNGIRDYDLRLLYVVCIDFWQYKVEVLPLTSCDLGIQPFRCPYGGAVLLLMTGASFRKK